ncbi:hypothetical protein J8F10_08930 [Gemmata sp. G18]|uniref:Uncharacterized protein n=1 Tax=Gemmata palustris TaxID=2822762 RepID=A0ABS5BNY5_9BACT|nr:hypothetical protein [Gemmata palustris]MBP3955403.1 hypothetical protein [Gemmata palustris]
MKEYLILKDFTGSQTGIDTDSFIAGTTRKLSDPLATALGGPAGGFIKAAGEAAAEIAKAPPVLSDAVKKAIADAELQPRELAEGETLTEADLPEGSPLKRGASVNPAELRETKVTGPAETKPAKPLNKMSKAELVGHALAQGLELVPDTMNVKQMIAAIEAHTAPAA